MQITLPEDNGTQFNLDLLLRHMIAEGITHIIIGQQHVALANHTKDRSLDYWLRTNIAGNQDTAQATNEVIEQICNSGLFVRSNNLMCSNTNQVCSGIELVQ